MNLKMVESARASATLQDRMVKAMRMRVVVSMTRAATLSSLGRSDANSATATVESGCDFLAPDRWESE